MILNFILLDDAILGWVDRVALILLEEFKHIDLEIFVPVH
jgi:hypothetical protein